LTLDELKEFIQLEKEATLLKIDFFEYAEAKELGTLQ
jgi:hypothetical protein